MQHFCSNPNCEHHELTDIEGAGHALIIDESVQNLRLPDDQGVVNITEVTETVVERVRVTVVINLFNLVTRVLDTWLCSECVDKLESGTTIEELISDNS